jgi:ribosome maturation factor RimP
MEIVEKIKELAQNHLQDPAHFIVDAMVSKHKPFKVTILLDGDKGITIDDCSHLSRKLSDDLDKLDLLQENYTLEVGTPGVDQPLKWKRQYVKNIGRTLKVKKNDKAIVQGVLTSATDEFIVLEVMNKDAGKKKESSPVQISFHEIEKALVMISFK